MCWFPLNIARAGGCFFQYEAPYFHPTPYYNRFVARHLENLYSGLLMKLNSSCYPESGCSLNCPEPVLRTVSDNQTLFLSLLSIILSILSCAAYCLLLTAYGLLLTAYCLSTAYCLLLTHFLTTPLTLAYHFLTTSLNSVTDLCFVLFFLSHINTLCCELLASAKKKNCRHT